MSYTLTIDEVVNSFVLEDVTEDKQKLDVAFALVGNAYTAFSSGAVNPEEIYQELCRDVYYQSGLARIFLLTGYNPTTERSEPLGTLGMVLGASCKENPQLPPFESMRLLDPPEGWPAFRFAHFSLENALEFRRFSISPQCRQGKARTFNVHLLVLKALVSGIYDIATQCYGKSQAWMITLPYIAKVMENAGVEMTLAPGLRLNYRDNEALFAKYDKYWLDNTPSFYKVSVRK